MVFKPLDKMRQRVEAAGGESDLTLFYDLICYGEMVVKCVVAGLTAAIADDPDRHRYRIVHRLVRADGIGEWCQVLADIATGTARQHLVPEAFPDITELTQKLPPGNWQYEAVNDLVSVSRMVASHTETLGAKTDLRQWFTTFAFVRNKTKGHGAPTGRVCTKAVPSLQRSIAAVAENLGLFKRPWAYLHRNLSGTYRVTKFNDNCGCLDRLKSAKSATHEDGVYVVFGSPLHVTLMDSDVDALEFFFPNGGFNGKKYEEISYVTGAIRERDAGPYLAPATDLPVSATQGLGDLDVQGASFGNLPPRPMEYIHRRELEGDLRALLLDDHTPLVTLAGRGGIGKTSTALEVLHAIAETGAFGALVWFSARDVDLLAEGPKIVKRQVVTDKDIAEQYARLLGPQGMGQKGFEAPKYFRESLGKSPVDKPFLFVFDNFETVERPTDLYSLIRNSLRLPNKVLITTRTRDFKGDYAVEVLGMTESECEELIDATASRLAISALLTGEYRASLIKESDGHPYVVKILLGEVAKANHVVKVERIVAAKDDILDALFERTYCNLSPGAKRVYLTLCSWRSVLPLVAVEAVMLRPENERMDVEGAVEELQRSSFVEVIRGEREVDTFLSVPLASGVFGRKKLQASPHKSAVEADSAILQCFGASQKADLRYGLAPRVERMFRFVSERVVQRRDDLAKYAPILEFMCRRYAPAWLLLARLYEESDPVDGLDNAKDALTRFLEVADRPEDQASAWQKLAVLCSSTGDALGEMHALVEGCEVPDVPYSLLSSTANRLNSMLRERRLVLDPDTKLLVVRKLIEKMERRLQEANATDCSRLAWLCLHADQPSRARAIASHGLGMDPSDIHCLNVFKKSEMH